MRAEEFLLDQYPSWMDRGACTKDPERFMAATVREKKALCRVCPVRQDCLTYALEQGEDSNVWGGRDFGRRRRLRDLCTRYTKQRPTAPR